MLLRIVLLNQKVFEGLDKGLSRLKGLFTRLSLPPQGLEKGSRINIAAHYDLGNDFYALLPGRDPDLLCAIFDRPGSSLGEASLASTTAFAGSLAFEDDHVLEIGTGWGGFAIHAPLLRVPRDDDHHIKGQHDLAIETDPQRRSGDQGAGALQGFIGT